MSETNRLTAPFQALRTAQQTAAGLTVACAALFGGGNAQAGMVINFVSDIGDPQINALFAQAGVRWSNLFNDNVTLNFEIHWRDLGANVLGTAGSNSQDYSYSAVRQALLGDATSADDATASAHLQSAAGLNLLINRTSDNTFGAGSATPYQDNDAGRNNTMISITNANAKALGLLSGTNSAVDASITFNSNPLADLDTNPLDGVTPFAFDLLGIATHEIGHALGFISGVDVLDRNTGFTADDYNFVTPLDLFRYSRESAAVGAIDWTADTRAKYLSIDGGATDLARFSTGRVFGDGAQASHWKDDFDQSRGYDRHYGYDDFNIGLMDPTAPYGPVAPVISALDILAFDVIGWDRKRTEVPEPGSLALVGLGLVGLVAMRKPKLA